MAQQTQRRTRGQKMAERRVKHEQARQIRQSEAEARQAERDARSDEEQIVLLRSRPGNSARELARLEASK